MFRKAINGTWGSPIPTSNNGDSDTQEFSIVIDPNWDKNHCSVIAYVYKTGPDYEILQAEELHITETP